jgi:hypothetical protein
MKADALQAAHAERRQSVVILQAPKLSLDGCASPIEVAEALSVARDAREQPTATPSARGSRRLGRKWVRVPRRLLRGRTARSVDSARPLGSSPSRGERASATNHDQDFGAPWHT